MSEPYLLIEVNVAGAIVGADNKVIGGNVADATIQFGWRAGDIPDDLTDPMILEAIRRQLGPVVALIQMTMTANKWAYFGTIEEPALGGSVPTGETLRTDAVRVAFPMHSTGANRA